MRNIEQKKKPSGWKLLRTKFRKNGGASDLKEEPKNVSSAHIEAATATSSSSGFSRNRTPSRLSRTKTITPGRFKRSGGGTESLLQKSDRESEPGADDPNAEERDPDTDFVTDLMSKLTVDPPSLDRVSSNSDKILPDHAALYTVITVMSSLPTPNVDDEEFPALSSASRPSPKLVSDFDPWDPWEDDKSTRSEKPWKSIFDEDPFPHDEPPTFARADPSQGGSKPSTLAGSNPSRDPPAWTRSESSSLSRSHLSPQVLPTGTRSKSSILSHSDSSPQDLPTWTRSKPSTFPRSDPQVLPSWELQTAQVFRNKRSSRIIVHAPSELEESLTTHKEDMSKPESLPKTKGLSYRNNNEVKTAEEFMPETSTNASLTMYSPNLWAKVEEENDIEPWDTTSSKTSVAVKAPVQAEEQSMSAEDMSKLETLPKTQASSNRNNNEVKKAEEFMPKTSTNASLSMYSPNLWAKAEDENDIKPLDTASSKASVAVKAPVQAEEQSRPKDSSEAKASPTRLQTKAIIRKKTKDFMRKKSTVVPSRRHLFCNDSCDLKSSYKTNSVDISVAEDTIVQDDASKLTTSEAKNNISVAKEISLAVGDGNVVMQDESTGLMLSESKSCSATSVADEILADDLTENEVLQDDLELMLSESKRVGAISVAEEILTDELMLDDVEVTLFESKRLGAISVAEWILKDELTKTEAMQNDSADLKISDSKSFGAASVAEEILAYDVTDTKVLHDDSAEPKISESNSFGATSVAEEILANDLTDTEEMQNVSAELKLSDSKSFGANSVPEKILAVDLTDNEAVHDDSTEPLVSPMSPVSRSSRPLSSQSDSERSLQKKALAVAAAHKAQREKAKVNDDRPFDENGDSPNEREEVAQEAVDDFYHNGTLIQILSSDASEDNMADLKLLTELDVSCEPMTGESMVATKPVDASILWKSANGDSWSRIMPSSSPVIDEDVGMERGPRERRHRTALHEVQGSGSEEEEKRLPTSLESPRATKQDKTTPRTRSIHRSPDRRHHKFEQIRKARRMLRSGLWQKSSLTDRIVVQEGDGEVEIVLEKNALPRKKYYKDSDSEYNATASCTDDGSTSLYGDSAWIDDFDGDSRCYSIKDESRSHFAGPGSYVSAQGSYGSAPGSYISDSDDYSTEPEEIWDDITELFKLQWRDAWQAT